MSTVLLQIISLPPFEKKARKQLTEDELSEFKEYISANPEKGDVIPRTGGLRKLDGYLEGKVKEAVVELYIFTM